MQHFLKSCLQSEMSAKSATSFILKICYIRYYEDTSLNTKNLKVCVIRYQTHLGYTNILTVNPSLPQGCEIKPKEKGTIVTASRLNNSTVRSPRDLRDLRSDHRASFSFFNYLPFSLLVRMVILWSFGYEKNKKPSINFRQEFDHVNGGVQHGSKTFFSVADFKREEQRCFFFRDHEDPWVFGFWYMSTWYKGWILPV